MRFAPHASCRQILREEFERRHARNLRFSLRAFAKFLGVAPSTLSEILKDKHGPSAAMAQKFADRLGYRGQDREYFVALAQGSHEKSSSARESALRKIARYKSDRASKLVTDDTLEVISNWYHYALLELMTLEGFRSELGWIARALDLPENTIALALARLKRLGLVEEKNGRLISVQPTTVTPVDVPSRVRRQYHAGMLSRANAALRTQAVDDRDFSTVTFSLNRTELAMLKAKIRDFRRGLTDECARDARRDGVYCLSIQLFDLLPSLKDVASLEGKTL